MYELLQIALNKVYEGMILQSHFLGEDVGGFYGFDFTEALEKVLDYQGIFAIGTSCRCHGVIDLLKLS